MKPVRVHESDLGVFFHSISMWIGTRDTLQGSIEYDAIADEPGFFMVTAVVRTGQSAGQGGMMIVGDTTEEPAMPGTLDMEHP